MQQVPRRPLRRLGDGRIVQRDTLYAWKRIQALYQKPKSSDGYGGAIGTFWVRTLAIPTLMITMTTLCKISQTYKMKGFFSGIITKASVRYSDSFAIRALFWYFLLAVFIPSIFFNFAFGLLSVCASETEIYSIHAPEIDHESRIWLLIHGSLSLMMSSFVLLLFACVVAPLLRACSPWNTIEEEHDLTQRVMQWVLRPYAWLSVAQFALGCIGLLWVYAANVEADEVKIAVFYSATSPLVNLVYSL